MNDYAIGIDLGGTKIAFALVNRQGQVKQELIEPTRPEQGVIPVIDRIAASILSLIGQADGPVLGIGVGAAGMTDSKTGTILLASNLKWKNVPLHRLIYERIGAEWAGKLWIEKDTNTAVLGEMFYGTGQGSRHLLYVTVGTGIGGGMVLDGKLYHGASEGASDIGHLVLERDGPVCGCGKQGCLEALASGPALARMAHAALQNDQPSSLAELEPERITAREVVAAAQEGDILAISLVHQAGEWIGIGLALYVDINNPERIIIGGGVASAGELLLDPIRKAIEKYALTNNAQTVQVLPAGLGINSGVVGAASLVWQHILDHKE
jgi:glucokinase